MVRIEPGRAVLPSVCLVAAVELMLSALLDRYFIKQPRLRHFVSRLVEGDKDSQVSLLGTSLVINSLREHGYLRASRLVRSSSLLRDEVPVLLTLSGILPFCDAFIDIGANVGIYSKVLYRLTSLFPHVAFYAFEADPDTFKRLVSTISNTSIDARWCAISDAQEELVFVRGAVSHVSAVKTHASDYSLFEEFRVQGQRLDSVGLRGSRMMIKVDVEGHEFPVLRGADLLFAQNRVLGIYFDGCSDIASIRRFLVSRGFILLEAMTMSAATSSTFPLLALNRNKCCEQGLTVLQSPYSDSKS